MLALVSNGRGSAIIWNIPEEKPVEKNVQLESFVSICWLVLLLDCPVSQLLNSKLLGYSSESSLLHSLLSALIQVSELSLLCYRMVNVPLNLFLFPQITCRQPCVLPMSKIPLGSRHPLPLGFCPLVMLPQSSLWPCLPWLSQHLPCTDPHLEVPS